MRHGRARALEGIPPFTLEKRVAHGRLSDKDVGERNAMNRNAARRETLRDFIIHRAPVLLVGVLFATALTVPAASATVCVSPQPGLIARWPGNGSTNEVAHGRDGSLVGDATFAAGELGQAFSFDGGGDAVSAPDDPDWTLGGDDFTVDAWVNITAASGEPQTILAHDPGAGLQPKWMLWYRDGNLQFFLNTATDAVEAVTTPWAVTYGQWYHVAVTRSGSVFTAYIDGVAVATGSNAAVIPDAVAPLTIGGAEPPFWLNGLVDEAEIYQRALSAAEIAAIHEQGGDPRCAPTGSTLTLTAPGSVTSGDIVSLAGVLTVGGRHPRERPSRSGAAWTKVPPP
jgi:hypothetical protein